ncbi:cytochrome C biogenesis protein DipZ [Alsobacter metallidurans]|uniref:Cytochrome C biogenesis protein DipZ n=1 Tax=Alsobacter metallidurans TaxID=340221 RepID=A0A917MJW1_9HYPH|nr:redoxin family protein [Alsobacter metallidurans]GGH31813.1 cytochrome C biogenesis protein DipZ [Alsobacter metallidurans]
MIAASFLAVCFLAGALTIASPCILPVVPFVFAGHGQPFLRGTLPLLAGLVAAFASVVALAATGAAWAAEAHEVGRALGLVVLAFAAATLLSSRLAAFAARPFTNLGGRLSEQVGTGAGASVVTGLAAGLLWSPCAGPVLALILAGGAASASPLATGVAAGAYAAGAAASLAVIVLAGRRLATGLRAAASMTHRLRQVAGVAALGGVVAIASGFDATVLAQLPAPAAGRIESALVGRLPATAKVVLAPASKPSFRSSLPVLGDLPSLAGATGWLNGPPLAAEALRGKVVLVQFWTYSCINCIRTLPFVRTWAETFAAKGLAVVGVHTPEFAFEHNESNVRRALARFGLTYPVAIDNGFKVWRAFGNESWPGFALADAQGRIRYRTAGEGQEARTEQAIRDLLAEAGAARDPASTPAAPPAPGEQAAADWDHLRSDETYLGYAQASRFASREIVAADRPQVYSYADLPANRWGLSGAWTIAADRAIGAGVDGRVAYRFNARDLHLVLGAGRAANSIRFQVTVDGHAPGPDHGSDIDAEGFGAVSETRLYQLVRQADGPRVRTVEIRFLDPGVEAYAFTFG